MGPAGSRRNGDRHLNARRSRRHRLRPARLRVPIRPHARCHAYTAPGSSAFQKLVRTPVRHKCTCQQHRHDANNAARTLHRPGRAAQSHFPARSSIRKPHSFRTRALFRIPASPAASRLAHSAFASAQRPKQTPPSANRRMNPRPSAIPTRTFTQVYGVFLWHSIQF